MPIGDLFKRRPDDDERRDRGQRWGQTQRVYEDVHPLQDAECRRAVQGDRPEDLAALQLANDGADRRRAENVTADRLAVDDEIDQPIADPGANVELNPPDS